MLLIFARSLRSGPRPWPHQCRCRAGRTHLCLERSRGQIISDSQGKESRSGELVSNIVVMQESLGNWRRKSGACGQRWFSSTPMQLRAMARICTSSCGMIFMTSTSSATSFTTGANGYIDTVLHGVPFLALLWDQLDSFVDLLFDMTNGNIRSFRTEVL